MFLTWLLTSTVHLTWLRIPMILARMETLSEILSGIFNTTPLEYRDPSRPFQITQEFTYDESNSKVIDQYLNRLQYLLTEKPFLKRSYLIKHLLVFILCGISIVLTLCAIIAGTKYEITFLCDLVNDPPYRRGYPTATNDNSPSICHLNSGFFILFAIHFDLLIRVSMTVLSAFAIIWIFRHSESSIFMKRNDKSLYKSLKSRNKKLNDGRPRKSSSLGSLIFNEQENVFGDADAYLSGLPSFQDLVFWVELLKRNSHDGHLMYYSIRSAIRSYCKKFKFTYSPLVDQKNLGNANTNFVKNIKSKESVRATKINNGDVRISNLDVMEPSGLNPEYLKVLQDNSFFLCWICTQLGLRQIPNDFNPNHLFQIISDIRDSLGIISLDVKENMRELIANEIQNNPDIYKTLIDDDVNFPTYEVYCERIRQESMYGSKFIIYAAATLFRVRIVVIHFNNIESTPELYNPKRQNVILSQKKDTGEGKANISNENSSLPFRFITMVEPHYYSRTDDEPLDSDWPQIMLRRSKYMNNDRFRADMKAASIRYIGEINDIVEFSKNVLKVENPSSLLFS